MIPIEYRTHGDHEELKILLQSWLIASQFNRKLSYKERISIYRKIDVKNAGQLIHWKNLGWLRWHDFDGPQSRNSLIIVYPILIRVSLRSHVLLYESPHARVNRDHWIPLTQSTDGKCARVLLVIRWIRFHKIDACRLACIDLTSLELPRYLQRKKGNIVPHEEKEAKKTRILGKLVIKVVSYIWA